MSVLIVWGCVCACMCVVSWYACSMCVCVIKVWMCAIPTIAHPGISILSGVARNVELAGHNRGGYENAAKGSA